MQEDRKVIIINDLNEALAIASEEVTAIVRGLADDARFIIPHLGEDRPENERQFGLRIFTHRFFAAVEGLVYALKRQSIALANRTGTQLTSEQVAIINEITYSLNERGELNVQKMFIKLKPNFLFAYKTFSQVCFSNFEIDKGSHHWEGFCKCIKIRDRITHPKNSGELLFSSEEATLMAASMEWFEAITIECLTTGLKSLGAERLRRAAIPESDQV